MVGLIFVMGLSYNIKKCSNFNVLMVLGVWVIGTASRSFTQCERIKESNCIHHSQYIQLLRRLGSNRLLESSESNAAKRFVDIKPYVLLLKRLISMLVQYYPKDDNTRDLNCTPDEFLKILGADLLHTKVVVGAEDPPDYMGLYVTGNCDVYIVYLHQVVCMLQR